MFSTKIFNSLSIHEKTLIQIAFPNYTQFGNCNQ